MNEQAMESLVFTINRLADAMECGYIGRMRKLDELTAAAKMLDEALERYMEAFIRGKRDRGELN